MTSLASHLSRVEDTSSGGERVTELMVLPGGCAAPAVTLTTDIAIASAFEMDLPARESPLPASTLMSKTASREQARLVVFAIEPQFLICKHHRHES
jgi:hypothetical protein